MSLFPITATIPQGGISLQEKKLANRVGLEGGSPLTGLSRAEEEIPGGGRLPGEAGQGAAQNALIPISLSWWLESLVDGAQ